MAEPARGDSRLYRRLSWTGVGLVFGLIVLGGWVRISGSGMGCGAHWPLCKGEWFPPLDLPTLIEIGHRWVAALVTVCIFALGFVAWRRHRQDRYLRAPATLAVVLLEFQVILGPIIVKLDLPPAVVVVHLLNAMVLLAVVMVCALRSTSPLLPPERRHRDHPLVLLTAGLGFVVIFYGALVANLNAGLVCQGFPLCEGRLGPPATTLGLVQWTHRILAFLLLALITLVTIRQWRGSEPERRPLRLSALAVLIATLAQIGVAAAMVLNLLPPALRAAHLLTGTLLWSLLAVLVWYSARTPALVAATERVEAERPGLARDLLTLTKPRIISLLLVTTVAPMFITPLGTPSAALVFWVIVGGYLMAGGANAINMWFDRDIDDKMSRTRLRPIPSGRLSPASGLAFGVSLGVLAFAIFWHFVNPLSAWLALSGLLFYVFVYTMWLKRTSPQNIVIGGAAGAFPPLVGWTAVTGQLDLAALYLFAIVFYWTPPHFWALALIKQGEYARAGVPMLPVVRGDRETKIQMLLYTLMLLPLTLMPSVFGALGWFYAVAAALLGGRLLWYCVRLLREHQVTPTAWRMYRYSLLYLALLFAAMGIDRALPFGHAPSAKDVIILDQPDSPGHGPMEMPASEHQHVR